MLPEEILKTISYDPETGIFTRKGKPFGNLNGKGYMHTTIMKKGIKYHINFHRLAFYYMDGVWLSSDIFVDHINRIRNDNRWCNLRTVTRSQNSHNYPSCKDSSSEYRGVTYYPKLNKWRVRITDIGKRQELGFYNSEREAAIIYNEAAKKRSMVSYLNPVTYTEKEYLEIVDGVSEIVKNRILSYGFKG